MSNLGWVKLHRSMLDWEWYSDVNVCRLFMHFILVANHKDGNWRGIEIKRGQRLTSLNKLESETGLTKSQIRTAIKKLISTNEIAQESHSQHTVFTVVNYDSYQGDDTHIDTPMTNESHANDTPMTPNKNVKNENNENKKNGRFKKPTEEDLISYFKEYCSTGNFDISFGEHRRFYDFYESKNWYVGKNKMKDWKAAVRNWLSKHKKEPVTPQQRPRAFGE